MTPLNRASSIVPTPKKKKVVQTPGATFVDQSQEMYGAGVKPIATPGQTTQPITPASLPTAPIQKPIPVQPTAPTPTTDAQSQEMYGQAPQKTTQPTPEQPVAPQEERIGQSRTEEQQIQDNIDKTQEELMNLRNREDALSQAEYLKKTKELQEYQTKQKEITDKQKAMTEEQTQIQSSRRIQEAQKKLSRTKRNIAYLSSQGLGQSAEALDAFSYQISNAENVFKEMEQYEQYAEEFRKLGLERDSNEYERGMKEQQDELDKAVSDTIQTIFNNMSAAEMAGEMDTVDEVDAFATKYFNSIDTDIANMTRKQIQIAENKLALQTQTLERAREFVANKGIVNKDMSAVQGYYVDGNGQPLISATTGGIIPMPVDAPMEPVFNEKTGQLVTFSLGENGEIVANTQQVIDMPTFGASTIANMAKAVANGTMTVAQALDVLPQASQQAFLDQIGDIPSASKFEFKTVGDQAYSYDPSSGIATPVAGIGGATGDLRGLASQFPGQARAKNNNPAGITWNSNFDTGKGTAALLQNAGISYEKGTARPEGGFYVTFPTIEEGLAAQRIIMSQTYANSTVNQMLGKWVGTGEALNYAQQVAGNAGIDGTQKMSELNEQQLSVLQMAKIQKESPGLAKLLGQDQGTQEIGVDDIINFNDDVTRRKMSKEEVKRIGEAKKAIMSDPNADINQIMQYSAGGKAIGETASKSLIKFDQALSQLDAVQKQISSMKTGPIIGKIRNMNPRDTDAQVLKATIQGLIPTIARGVYGEVGVLTDNDVRLYAQTLPNLRGTDAINKGVLAVTLDVLAGGYKKQLIGLAGQGYDVSGLEGMYENLKGQANILRDEIGVGDTQPTALPPAKKQASDDLRDSL